MAGRGASKQEARSNFTSRGVKFWILMSRLARRSADAHHPLLRAAHLAYHGKLRREQRTRQRLDGLRRAELAVVSRRSFQFHELARRHEHARLERAD